MGFLVTLTDDTTREVDGADSYEQEGPLTTFFTGDGRPVRLDSAFSNRIASFRTDRVTEIRRVDAQRAGRVSPSGLRSIPA